MITEDVPTFRSLTPDMVEKSGFSFENYDFSYTYEKIEYPITISANSDKYTIEIPGKKCQWRSDADNLTIRRKCTIKKPSVLFDLNNGVASCGSSLGLAVKIKSLTSLQKIVIPFDGEIIENDHPIDLYFEYTLPETTYIGTIELETILYLKKTDKNNPNPLLANRVGEIIGYPCYLPTTLIVDGKSNEFKTYERSKGSKSELWELFLTWKNPLIDPFDDTVYIVVNTDHPDYRKIDIRRDDRDLSLICEIYSSAITQLIWKLKYEEEPAVWTAILKSDADLIKPGSVADYVCYIVKERLESNCEDILDLSKTIRKIIYGGL